MKNKKIPLRTCVVTKEQYPKQELIRIVINKNNEIFIDESGKANGRGVYLKKDIEVIEKAKKTKILNAKLKEEVPAIIYEELLKMINK